jgi:hypothetical protein
MVDFGILPPEITSGRLYGGPGAGSLMTAATAWSQVAAELDSTATAYSSVLQDLSGVWYGPSATTIPRPQRPTLDGSTSTLRGSAMKSIAQRESIEEVTGQFDNFVQC